MSAKVSGMVFDRYPVDGGEMLLALAIADHAHDDGTHIFPSVSHLSAKKDAVNFETAPPNAGLITSGQPEPSGLADRALRPTRNER